MRSRTAWRLAVVLSANIGSPILVATRLLMDARVLCDGCWQA
mgnify:CR=1 FL=1